MAETKSSKKPYRSPQFHNYGELRDLTKNNPAGAGVDDGHPSMNRKT